MRDETVPAANGRILLIDDDDAILRSVERALRSEGYDTVLLCHDPREAVNLLAAHAVDVILLDLVMPHISGEQLLPVLREAVPETPVIVVTAMDQVDTAVRCIRAGAFDYLVKPVDFSRLIADVARGLQQRSLRVENRELRERLQSPALRRPECFARLVTRAPSMLAIFRYIEAIAGSSEPVLLVGETGVGKELIADAIHQASGRTGPAVSVNVAGLDENAFNDTLFGHVKGAFTGADREREGLVAQAAGGTLLLDEIGDLSLELQVRLLRLLQEREFLPLGADRSRAGTCRVIAATNRDLRGRLRDGRFREDLYYRLHAHTIRIPPLRERPEDVPLLAEKFLREAAEALGRPVPTPPKELFVHLATYPFPGNVRELRAMVFDAVAQHTKGILPLAVFHDHMNQAADAGKTAPAAPPAGEAELVFGRALPTFRRATELLIREALQRADGNQGIAARMLDISRRTVNRFATQHPPA